MEFIACTTCTLIPVSLPEFISESCCIMIQITGRIFYCRNRRMNCQFGHLICLFITLYQRDQEPSKEELFCQCSPVLYFRNFKTYPDSGCRFWIARRQDRQSENMINFLCLECQTISSERLRATSSAVKILALSGIHKLWTHDSQLPQQHHYSFWIRLIIRRKLPRSYFGKFQG